MANQRKQRKQPITIEVITDIEDTLKYLDLQDLINYKQIILDIMNTEPFNSITYKKCIDDIKAIEAAMTRRSQ
jgi:hypothetical protein